jgi:hypothetical protein
VTRLGEVFRPGLGIPKSSRGGSASGNLQNAERSPVWLVSSRVAAAQKGETAQPPPTSQR